MNDFVHLVEFSLKWYRLSNSTMGGYVAHIHALVSLYIDCLDAMGDQVDHDLILLVILEHFNVPLYTGNHRSWLVVLSDPLYLREQLCLVPLSHSLLFDDLNVKDHLVKLAGVRFGSISIVLVTFLDLCVIIILNGRSR